MGSDVYRIRSHGAEGRSKSFVLTSANMKDEHAQFSGPIPAAYDRYLGPMLFQPYAEDLAARSPRH